MDGLKESFKDPYSRSVGYITNLALKRGLKHLSFEQSDWLKTDACFSNSRKELSCYT